MRNFLVVYDKACSCLNPIKFTSFRFIDGLLWVAKFGYNLRLLENFIIQIQIKFLKASKLVFLKHVKKIFPVSFGLCRHDRYRYNIISNLAISYGHHKIDGVVRTYDFKFLQIILNFNS